jgi:phosphoenolpyruvate synthase/pyruvate phosphate dikinase
LGEETLADDLGGDASVIGDEIDRAYRCHWGKEATLQVNFIEERKWAMDYIARFETLSMHDVDKVGGKNSSLGEMIHNLTDKGVRVPGGFATTADAFREYLAHNGLADRIAAKLTTLNVDDTQALAEAGREIRGWMMEAPLPAGLEAGIRHNHRLMCAEAGEDLEFAVRSSATAEDLPDASFAGQQETFLNIKGADNLIDAVKLCFASLYNDRAISYRVHNGFEHAVVALVRRHPAHGALRSGRGRCDVHHGYRIRFPRRGVHQCRLRPR